MFDIDVRYEDGTEVTVTAGQREMAAWEAAGYGNSVEAKDQRPILFFRFLAYAALKRLRRLPEHPTKGVTYSFDGWSDLVEEAIPDGDDEDEADPTTQGQPSAD